MSGFPWRVAICIGAAALVSPLLAGAVAMSNSDSWLGDVLRGWFFALPSLAYELGVPTDEGEGVITVVYALQYLAVWWVSDTARALFRPSRSEAPKASA